jgi:hypothetical protein
MLHLHIVGAAVVTVILVAMRAGCSHSQPTLSQQCEAILTTPSAYSTQQVAICRQYAAVTRQSGICQEPNPAQGDSACNY